MTGIRVAVLAGVLALSGAALGLSPALAADPGQVTTTAGLSFVTANGLRNPLKMNDPVHVGDVIEVVDDAKLKLSMSDGSTLSLGSNSRLTIAAYTADPGADRDVQLALDAGVMRATVTPSGQTSRFEVDTPNAIATVRGTDFFIEVTPQNTSIRVIEGSVGISRRGVPNTPQNVMALNANWMADIDTGRDPPKVKPWSQPDVDALIARTSVGLGWCQCIADRTDIRASCMGTVEDCRSTCGSTTVYSFIPDARQTCGRPGLSSPATGMTRR